MCLCLSECLHVYLDYVKKRKSYEVEIWYVSIINTKFGAVQLFGWVILKFSIHSFETVEPTSKSNTFFPCRSHTSIKCHEKRLWAILLRNRQTSGQTQHRKLDLLHGGNQKATHRADLSAVAALREEGLTYMSNPPGTIVYYSIHLVTLIRSIMGSSLAHDTYAFPGVWQRVDKCGCNQRGQYSAILAVTRINWKFNGFLLDQCYAFPTSLRKIRLIISI